MEAILDAVTTAFPDNSPTPPQDAKHQKKALTNKARLISMALSQ
jgi:hypothetical protein